MKDIALDFSCFNWVQLVKKADIPKSAKYFCLYLSTFMNHENDIAWPSQSRITHETGLDIKTLRKATQWLEENEWLVVKRKSHVVHNSHNKQNEYSIGIPSYIVSDNLVVPKTDPPKCNPPKTHPIEVPKTDLVRYQNAPYNNNVNNNLNNNVLFDQFWSLYPNKVGKVNARKKFNRLSKKNQQLVIDDVKKRKEGYGPWAKGMVLNPNNYLSDGRWEDEWSLDRIDEFKELRELGGI